MAFHSYNYDFNINDFNINDFNINNFNINDFNIKAQDSSLENRLVVFNPGTICSYPATVYVLACKHISITAEVIA